MTTHALATATVVAAMALHAAAVRPPAPRRAAGPPPAAAQDAGTGVITGTAQSGGRPLPNHTVQLRNLQTGTLAAAVTSNAAGIFSFVGLNPANYVIEVVSQTGAIIGTSSAVTVVAGATVTVTVGATAAAAAAAAAATSTAFLASTAGVVSVAAATAGIAGVVVAEHATNASPSR